MDIVERMYLFLKKHDEQHYISYLTFDSVCSRKLYLDIMFRKKKKISCVCNWILFSEKKIFVSCDCDWKLFSEKRFLFLVFVIGYYFQKQKRFLILVTVIGYYFQKKDFCFLCL